MKKSSFVALILGGISVMFFGVGMSMALVTEWNAFTPGIVMGCVGLVFALITIFVWRKMENKAPIRLNGKTVLTAVLGIFGALTLGLGMCMVMVWSKLVLGIVIGMVGILALLSLIPVAKGIY